MVESRPVHEAITYIENDGERMDYATARRRVHAPGDPFPKREVALGRRVLHGGGATRLEHAPCHGLQLLHREQLGRGETSRKRDHLRPHGDLQISRISEALSSSIRRANRFSKTTPS